MLDYLINLLSFSVDGQTYNLILTPWGYICDWIQNYINHTSNGAYSSSVRDAYYQLAKIGFFYSALIVVLIIICTWLVYKIASGFTGWFKFR